MTEKEFKTLKTRAEYRRFAVWASWRIPKFKYGLISHATPERPRNANIVFEKKFADELRLGTLAAPGIAALLLAASPASYGESLSDKAQRESETMAEQIKQGDNDKERWARVSLYSDSEEPEDLALTVIKNAGLAMKLDPLRGQLEFTSKGNRQAFTIATARDDKRTTCPKYNVRVIDASAKHAVLRRVCNEYEFRPNRFVASVDYFIYDAETATIRSIWHNEVTKKGSPLPVAKPVPHVRVIPNGYEFDWQAQNLSKVLEGPTEIQTVYLRKTIDGARSLVCTDNAAPKGQGLEAGYCEGERPPVVTK